MYTYIHVYICVYVYIIYIYMCIHIVCIYTHTVYCICLQTYIPAGDNTSTGHDILCQVPDEMPSNSSGDSALAE